MTIQPKMAQATDPTNTHHDQPHIFATFVQPLSMEDPKSFQTNSGLLLISLSIPTNTPMAQIPAETCRDLRKWEHPAAPPLPGLCAANANMVKKPKKQKREAKGKRKKKISILTMSMRTSHVLSFVAYIFRSYLNHRSKQQDLECFAYRSSNPFAGLQGRRQEGQSSSSALEFDY